MATRIGSVDDLCRLCAIESQSGVIIYSAEGENLCLEEKIINCLRIEVSRDDMLPKRVCQSCNLLLEDYYRFTERATQVQQTLYFLLGLHLPHVQEQEPQLCFIDDDVKVESNTIKKELDEFVIHQNIQHQLDGQKFDERLTREQKEFYDVRRNRRSEYTEVDVNGELNLMTDLIDGCEVKQMHRRKMLVPKKTVQEKSMEEVTCLGRKDDECYFEPHNEEENVVEDLNEESELSNEEEEEKEEEENKKLESEWRKQWGILCNECQNIFPDKLLFDSHYRLSHNKKPTYACSLCKKSLDKYSTYKLHIFEHIFDGRFKCRFCDKKLCSKEMLQIHSESLHGQTEIFACEECGMTFVSQSRLDLHKNRHNRPNREELRCSDCGKMLQTRSGLSAHKSVHKRGRHFMCHICGKTFTQKINMQQHVKHHKGERPHVCDICEKSFAEKSHLNRHKSFHMEDRPFQCPVCKKMYKTERCLKVHSQTHWNSRPYVCSFCGKGFLSSTKLKQHHNCHTGERPFACKYCERTFTNYPNWLKHTRRRHKVDHKTGLSLKEEARSGPPPPTNTLGDSLELPETAIEFVEMPDVEVKEDGRDSVQSLNMISTSVLGGSHFQIVEDAACHYDMDLMPELVATSTPHVVYTDHVIVDHQTLL